MSSLSLDEEIPSQDDPSPAISRIVAALRRHLDDNTGMVTVTARDTTDANGRRPNAVRIHTTLLPADTLERVRAECPTAIMGDYLEGIVPVAECGDGAEVDPDAYASAVRGMLLQTVAVDLVFDFGAAYLHLPPTSSTDASAASPLDPPANATIDSANAPAG
jgi:hypothetical protein